jgi:hypothetical protein
MTPALAAARARRSYLVSRVGRPRGWPSRWSQTRCILPAVPDVRGQRSNLCLKSRNKLSVPRLPDQRGARCLVSAMSSGRPAYELAIWLLLVEWIGNSLRKRYPPPAELPAGWLTRLPQTFRGRSAHYCIERISSRSWNEDWKLSSSW